MSNYLVHRDHKYIRKIGNRYFYSNDELTAFLNNSKVKTGLYDPKKDANNPKVGFSDKKKETDQVKPSKPKSDYQQQKKKAEEKHQAYLEKQQDKAEYKQSVKDAKKQAKKEYKQAVRDAEYEAESKMWEKDYQRRVDKALTKKRKGEKLSWGEHVLVFQDTRRKRKEIRNDFQRAKS